MPESQEQRDSSVLSSAGEPGPLSRLLQEIFEAPSGDLLDAWKKELQPGDRVGRFEIRREVGRGGFGAVYEAFDTELNRVVAVKTLRLSRPRRDLSSDWIKKEAEAVARLDHPSIVTLHDVGTCASGPYLVMELLRGKTLERRIAEGPVPPAEALRIAEEMAKGLAHAHRRGVVHRDLKPANVFLCEDGRVKLLDFGIAHLLGTEGGSSAGTPTYMAPEQERGEQVDERADVYAAGKVLTATLGEQRPRHLEQAIARATSSDPASRPRDGEAWLTQLRRARHAVERPSRMRRMAIFTSGGIALGALVAWLVLQGAPRPPVAIQAAPPPSIAVLPFVDMSPEQDQEYFGDGVAEEILVALSRVEGLRVPGRASSFWFKGKDARPEEIGRDLDVTHVLEGTVRRAGNTLRVTAAVVNASDGKRVWSQTFDRDFTDVFAIQDRIARDVAAAMRLTLLPPEGAGRVPGRPADAEAYRLYLLGKHLFARGTPADERAAARALRESVRLDPGFTPARAWLALVRWALGYGGPARPTDEVATGSGWPRANAEALREANEIISQDPGCAEGYWLRGILRTSVTWEWASGLDDLRRAMALDPGNPTLRLDYARALASAGRLAEALALTQEVARTDPLLASVYRWMGWFQAATGNLDAAVAALQRGLEVAPGDPYLLRELGFAFVLGGRIPEARATFERNPVPWMRDVGIALIEGGMERDPGPNAALDRLVSQNRSANMGITYQLAQVLAWRGDRDRAFAMLEQAHAEHDGGMNYVHHDPFLRDLRSDTRYAGLLRKMNLPLDP